MPNQIARGNKIRVLLVDDHAVIRVGLTTAAHDAPDMEIAAAVETGTEAIEAYRTHQPDVVVLDLRLQGMSGIETIYALFGAFKSVRVLIFSSYAKGDEIFRAMQAGASGFVLKEMSLDRVLEAIRAVYSGTQYMPPEISIRVAERILARLTPREVEILQLLGRGLSNKEIGAQLNVVEGTVKIHIANIFNKLDVSDRTQALVEAIKRGIVQIE